VTNEEAAQDRPRELRTGRMEAFSDGVFAIAITLLILEITVPTGSQDDLLRAVGDQWPSYLAYVVSFSTIGGVWLAHTAITEYLGRANAMLIRLNLLLLLVVSFLPFPTRLLAEYTGDDEAGRISTTIYGVTLLTAAVLVSVLWRYAVRERLVRPDMADEEVQTLTKSRVRGRSTAISSPQRVGAPPGGWPPREQRCCRACSASSPTTSAPRSTRSRHGVWSGSCTPNRWRRCPRPDADRTRLRP
jgi:uncharacterized membrane protein